MEKNQMGISEVVSPVTRPGSKVGSVTRAESPGARSDPGLKGGPKFDSVPPQSSHGRTSAHQELPGGTTKVTGPK